MRNILFLVDSYGSYASANGVVCERIINTLQNDNVFVICNKKNSLDKSYEEYNNVKIYRFWKDLSSALKCKFNSNFISRILEHISYLINLNKWPLRSKKPIKKNISFFNKIERFHKIDIVVGIFQSANNLYSAYLIKKMRPEIKFVIYTLDALLGSLSTSFKNKKQNLYKKMALFQHEMFFYADRIIALDFHFNYYNKNSSKYLYCFNKMKFCSIPLEYKNSPKQKYNIEPKITYTGYLYDKFVDLTKFREFCKNVPFPVCFYGGFTKKIYNTLKDIDNVHFYGFIPKEKIPTIQRQSMFLLSFGRDNETMIASKTYEYIISGRPVIHLYSDNNDATLMLLQRYNYGLNVKYCNINTCIDDIKNFNDINSSNFITKKFISDFINNTAPNKIAKEILEF